MYSIIPFFGCRYKSTLSGLMFLFCNPTIKNISYLILSFLSYLMTSAPPALRPTELYICTDISPSCPKTDRALHTYWRQPLLLYDWATSTYLLTSSASALWPTELYIPTDVIRFCPMTDTALHTYWRHPLLPYDRYSFTYLLTSFPPALWPTELYIPTDVIPSCPMTGVNLASQHNMAHRFLMTLLFGQGVRCWHSCSNCDRLPPTVFWRHIFTCNK